MCNLSYRYFVRIIFYVAVFWVIWAPIGVNLLFFWFNSTYPSNDLLEIYHLIFGDGRNVVQRAFWAVFWNISGSAVIFAFIVASVQLITRHASIYIGSLTVLSFLVAWWKTGGDLHSWNFCFLGIWMLSTVLSLVAAWLLDVHMNKVETTRE